MTTIRDFALTVMADSRETSLYSLIGNREAVIDFWTTKCTRCPAALDKLDEMASDHENVMFLSCALNDIDIASDIVDGSWENLTHVFMDEANKEVLKADFSFTQVPFCIVINKEKEVLVCGNPKDLDISNALQTAAVAGMQNDSNHANIPIAVSDNVFTDEDF